MTPTRADDDKLLHALWLRDRGHSIYAISRAIDIPRRTLTARMFRVDNAERGRFCAFKDCSVVLDSRNGSAVCRAHNHAQGYCQCGQCVGRVA